MISRIQDHEKDLLLENIICSYLLKNETYLPIKKIINGSIVISFNFIIFLLLKSSHHKARKFKIGTFFIKKLLIHRGARREMVQVTETQNSAVQTTK